MKGNITAKFIALHWIWTFWQAVHKTWSEHEQVVLHILTMAQRLSWSSNTGGFLAAAAGACTAGLPGLGAVCGAAALKGLGPWRNVGFLWVFISSVTFFSPAKFKVKNVLLKKNSQLLSRIIQTQFIEQRSSMQSQFLNSDGCFEF